MKLRSFDDAHPLSDLEGGSSETCVPSSNFQSSVSYNDNTAGYGAGMNAQSTITVQTGMSKQAKPDNYSIRLVVDNERI